jgi:hypothetical protein
MVDHLILKIIIATGLPFHILVPMKKWKSTTIPQMSEDSEKQQEANKNTY